LLKGFLEVVTLTLKSMLLSVLETMGI